MWVQNLFNEYINCEKRQGRISLPGLFNIYRHLRLKNDLSEIFGISELRSVTPSLCNALYDNSSFFLGGGYINLHLLSRKLYIVCKDKFLSMYEQWL